MNVSMWDLYIEEAAKITDRALSGIKDLNDWKKERELLSRQFMCSMGLGELPEKCALRITEAGKATGKGFSMKKLYYQILPDCWASACLYLPDPLPEKKHPSILITCGHAAIGTLGYQKHAILWARRGYVSMVFDTIEQNDNPGDHHGLYYPRRPDWVSLGYTAAGGEMWNSIRALDVLCTFPEVDIDNIGVTGASGGGAHSFYLTVADERIKAVASCCGVTLPKYTIDRQHLLTHCDCMFYHNFFQRDMSEFASLIAPRAALFCYGNKDYLFSNDEYKTLVKNMKKIYRLYGAENLCELLEYNGPHGYGQESVNAASEWFDKHLAGAPRPKIELSDNELPEKAISVFNGTPPKPNRLAMFPELLSPEGTVKLPQNNKDWNKIKAEVISDLDEKVFHLIKKEQKVNFKQLGDWLKGTAAYRKYRAEFQNNELWMETYIPQKHSDYVCIGTVNSDELARPMLLRLCDHAPEHSVAVIVPRFCGFNYCSSQLNYFLRAGCLTGLTPALLMLQDLFLCLPPLLNTPECKGKKAVLYGKGTAGLCALYYSIYDNNIAGVVLEDVPASHREDAYIPGILKVLDIQHSTGLLAPRKIGFVNSNPSLWTNRLYERLECGKNLIKDISIKAVMQRIIDND